MNPKFKTWNWITRDVAAALLEQLEKINADILTEIGINIDIIDKIEAKRLN